MPVDRDYKTPYIKTQTPRISLSHSFMSFTFNLEEMTTLNKKG